MSEKEKRAIRREGERKMSKNAKATTGRHKESFAYRADAMTKPFCLICGDHFGVYEFRGRAVCSKCVEYIRTNF